MSRHDEQPISPPTADRPDLTVIVVTHNRTDLALDTLRSARAAAGDMAVEWLVADSGSSDGTPDAIERECDHVRVLRHANVGFAAANNCALEIARGRYVLLLNPDVEIVEGTLSELVSTLDAHPEIGIASVIQRAPNGSAQYSIRRYPSPWLALGEAVGAARFAPTGRWREEEARAERYGDLRSVDWLVGAFLIARADAAREVGPLDERFFLYSEEIDWCYRFRRGGWGVYHVPCVTVVHHTGDGYRPDLSAQLSYAKLLFARKHYGRTRAELIRAALLLRHALRAAVLGAFGPRAGSWRERQQAERQALLVVLGRADPPFGGRRRGALGGPGPAAASGAE